MTTLKDLEAAWVAHQKAYANMERIGWPAGGLDADDYCDKQAAHAVAAHQMEERFRSFTRAWDALGDPEGRSEIAFEEIMIARAALDSDE